MATSRAALHLVDPVEDLVPVPVGLLVDALADAADLADDLDDGLEAIAQRLFAGNRPAAFNEIGRMAVRVDRFRSRFTALDPRPTKPTRPTRVA